MHNVPDPGKSINVFSCRTKRIQGDRRASQPALGAQIESREGHGREKLWSNAPKIVNNAPKRVVFVGRNAEVKESILKRLIMEWMRLVSAFKASLS